MIKKLTQEELKEIKLAYEHWDEPQNEEWVYDEITRRLSEMENLFRERTQELFHDRLKDFGDIKNSQKIWLIEKLLDHAHHSNEYVQSRINDYEMEDLNKETESRIIFEEIEKHFKTDFIEGRIFDYDLKSANEELATRQLLADCEMHTNDYVAKRIVNYKPKDFIIKLEEYAINKPFPNIDE